jgi:hypothetical protein
MDRLESERGEISIQALTVKNHIPTLGLLNHALACGNLGKTFFRCCSSEGEVLPPHTEDEHLPVHLVVFRLPSPILEPLVGSAQEASWAGDSRICAQNLMTKNKRTRAVFLQQNRRNLNGRARFSTPRGGTNRIKLHRETRAIWRPSHGSARTTESLRRVRLPLVSNPDTGERVLQGMRLEIESLSSSGEPQAPRPSDA